MFKCPKCGGDRIVVEGVEIYCLSKINSGFRKGRPCLYHLSGRERQRYRGLIWRKLITPEYAKNSYITEEDTRLAKIEQNMLSSREAKRKNKKYNKSL